MSKLIERSDGYFRYRGNTVDIELDPSRPDYRYRRVGNMEWSSDFPEGCKVQDDEKASR